MAVQPNTFKEAQQDGSPQVLRPDFVVDAARLSICIGHLACVGCCIVLKDDDTSVEPS
jgi:hypothetical protein